MVKGIITHVGVGEEISKNYFRELFKSKKGVCPIFMDGRMDGRFGFIPIPESTKGGGLEKARKEIEAKERVIGRKIFPRYRDIKIPGYSIEKFVPKEALDCPVHYDPEFETFTFGPVGSQYKFFRGLEKGDYVFFYTTMEPWTKERGYLGEPLSWYYIFAYFEVEEVLELESEPDEETLRRYQNNVHFKRAYIGLEDWKGMLVVKGSSNSKLLEYAVPITLNVLDYIFGKKSVSDLSTLFLEFNPKEKNMIRACLRMSSNIKRKRLMNLRILEKEDEVMRLLDLINYVQNNPEKVETFIKKLAEKQNIDTEAKGSKLTNYERQRLS